MLHAMSGAPNVSPIEESSRLKAKQMWLCRGMFGLVTAGLLVGVVHAQGPVPQGSPIPRILPTVPPSVAPGLTTPQPATSEAVPNVEVTIRRVVIDGATAFTTEQFNAMTNGLIGSTSLQKIEVARLAILNRYRDKGSS